MNYEQIFINNRAWIDEKTSQNDDFFKNLAKDHSPEYLVIGCSDSRVPVEQITGAEPGDIFVHRNIANLVNESDLNLMALLNFAVSTLQVKHIVVCGHTHCAGIRIVYDSDHAGSLEEWLKTARLVKDTNPGASYEDLIELNIKDQCRKLSELDLIRKSVKETGFPIIHGWLYKIETGKLIEVS